jgi:hypothetical protein
MQDQIMSMINQIANTLNIRGEEIVRAQEIAGDIVEAMIDYSQELSTKYETNRGMILTSLIQTINNYIVRGSNIGTAISESKVVVDKMCERAAKLSTKVTSPGK